ncbi:S8 family serine peptidase [Paenibacillus senegalimassiliensis]|uniref:S8 family serine peptidase n=1 Tax=Paenibacillus senegalimassiliensis TaxID=1737426 RepID=UPI00073F67B9|nr:S8 family serine peptidase [Paenibacillus senegalimassiliensis]
MRKTRIIIIDSGISQNSNVIDVVSESYVLNEEEGVFHIAKESPKDYIGHGTAVANIIYSESSNVDILSFRICDSAMEINEKGLVFVLAYIEQNLRADIINISAGVTHLSEFDILNNICEKIHKKGSTIIAAFDNDGAISYPAALHNVIGVDVKKDYESKNDIYYSVNGIVDIFVPDIYYRTIWKGDRTIIKGTSFAAAKITGMLSNKNINFDESVDKINILKSIANVELNIKSGEMIQPPNFEIQKAIIFPINKESKALLRFKDILEFEINGVYDERLSGNVGKKLYGEDIKSFDSIDWEGDFDTVVLSCTTELAAITKRNYSEEIINKAKLYRKNIYTFEQLENDYNRMYYPKISSSSVPHENFLKLRKPMIPSVGVFGTSSKQGKFTLQLEIVKKLREKGYKTGHISTEPSGYLFDADFVFHFGYHSYLKIQPWESISILNEMVWETQLKEKDILITGCQSGTLHYNDSQIEHFGIFQYAFLLGIMPDLCILCVNPHDDIDYIERTINFINSVDNGKVKALTIFPMRAVETLSGIKYKIEELESKKLNVLKEVFSTKFKIPVLGLGIENDMDFLVDLIINNFSE